MTEQNRAYSTLKIKEISEESREFVGIASTMTPDRMDDVVVPEGAEYKTPMPLLWMHNADDAVGEVTKVEVKDGQIIVTGKIASVDKPAQLRERLNEAWARIKSGLIRGLSIGFRPLEYSFIDETGGIKFTKWDWTELSLVTIPANQEASIALVKSLAQARPPKQADNKPVTVTLGVSGNPEKPHLKETNMNVTEQIKSFEEKLTELKEARKAIIEKAAAEGRTLDGEETNTFDETVEEISAVEKHLERLKSMQEDEKAKAAPVDEDRGKEEPVRKDASRVIVTDMKAENGLAFAQYVKMLGRAKGNEFYAAQIAESEALKGNIDKRVAAVLKAAVPSATTTDADWAGSLVHESDVVADFVSYLRDRTIIGQFGQGNIPAMRNVPADVPIDIQTSGGDAYWVGEGKAKPLTKWSYDTTKLSEFKVATIAAITQELLRKSTTAADTMIRNELAVAIGARLDQDFIDPSMSGTTNVSPASITNGAANQTSDTTAGATPAEKFETDFQYLVGQLIDAKLGLGSATLIMSTSNAFALSRIKDSLGNRVYPDISMTGGTIASMPVMVSDYIGDTVAVVVASELYLVDDGGLSIDMSDQASLEMKDGSLAGGSTAGTGASLVSMWQTNSIAFRAERFINWARRRDAAVAYVTAADYSAANAEA